MDKKQGNGSTSFARFLSGVEVLMDVRDNKACKMAIIKDSEGNGLMLHQIAPERAG